MLRSYRGIIVEIGGLQVSFVSDRGLTTVAMWGPNPVLRVGMWVDVCGGGIAGRFTVTPLSVFA